MYLKKNNFADKDNWIIYSLLLLIAMILGKNNKQSVDVVVINIILEIVM